MGRPRPIACAAPGRARPDERAGLTGLRRWGAAGQTNREIARELFVTVKAVESHLTGAHRKLEISSRRELPAALVNLNGA
jgi:Bacterial regulatory proteins, luxR family